MKTVRSSTLLLVTRVLVSRSQLLATRVCFVTMALPSPRLCFITEFLDPNSGVLWKYQLFYYPDTKEVEMVR